MSPYRRRAIGGGAWEPCPFTDILAAVADHYPLQWRADVLAQLDKGGIVYAGAHEFRADEEGGKDA